LCLIIAIKITQEEESEEEDNGYGYDNMTMILVDLRLYVQWWQQQQTLRESGASPPNSRLTGSKRAAPDAQSGPVREGPGAGPALEEEEEGLMPRTLQLHLVEELHVPPPPLRAAPGAGRQVARR